MMVTHICYETLGEKKSQSFGYFESTIQQNNYHVCANLFKQFIF